MSWLLTSKQFSPGPTEQSALERRGRSFLRRQEARPTNNDDDDSRMDVDQPKIIGDDKKTEGVELRERDPAKAPAEEDPLANAKGAGSPDADISGGEESEDADLDSDHPRTRETT